VAPAVVDVVTMRSVGLDPDLQPLEPVDPADLLRHVPPDGSPARFGGRELGSGFVISPDGYILTSAHLVDGSDDVLVRFSNGQHEVAATLVGLDRTTDLALIKVEEPTPSVVELGASKDLQAGDWVAAIGAPFGFSNTITAGIVSATKRPLPDESFVSYIQTDAAVNPGSSGGPLVNLKGEVVGVNSVIYSRTGGFMGVSFAIPIEIALDVSRQLRERGRVTRGRIGVQTQPLTDKLARSFKTPAAEGVLVAEVEAGGPGARAGLQAGDVVLKYNDTPVGTVEELSRSVAASKPGTAATLEIWRIGKRQAVSMEVAEAPADTPAPSPARPAAAANRLGLVLRDSSPAQRREIGIDYGLLVQIAQGPAGVSGLQPGDVITTFNHIPLTSRKQFDELVAAQQSGTVIALRIFRGTDPVYVAVTVPK
jgi:serine protease Do